MDVFEVACWIAVVGGGIAFLLFLAKCDAGYKRLVRSGRPYRIPLTREKAMATRWTAEGWMEREARRASSEPPGDT